MTDPCADAAPIRSAVYFAPAPESPWWRFGAHWLGRDEGRDAPLPQPVLPGIDAGVQRQLTAAPRHYGFHATLKAPIALRVGATREELVQRMQALAQRWPPVPLGELQVRTLSRFVALLPRAPAAALLALAAACVTELDELRAPAAAAELAKRRAAGLDAREDALLVQYGYPYVLERFRLHFTLSGNVDAATATRLIWAAEPEVSRLNAQAPLLLDRLCLFEQAGDRPFVRSIDFPLGG
jgi:putative phosphonate metabolism protein